MKRLISIALFLLFSFTTTVTRAVDTATPFWQKIDGDWETGSTAVIWKMAAWPGKDLVVASTRSNGLWSTADNGATWKRMGEPKQTPPNAGQAVAFTFDPADKNTMWTSGMYNYGVWKTVDGGKTFTHIGKFQNDHADGIAVDYTDPKRSIVLVGLHEQEHSLHRSTDNGATWERIGEKIPDNTAFTTDPIILDSKTFIINSAGYKKGETWGIYRSEDAGNTWEQVSKEGASGNSTITRSGRIFWSCLWDQHIISSDDHGKTWARVEGPAHGRVEEIAPGRLIALGGKDKTQLYVSKDDAKTWTPVGPPVPFKPRDFAYNATRNSLFVWVASEAKSRDPGSILRWDLPKDLEAAFATPAAP